MSQLTNQALMETLRHFRLGDEVLCCEPYGGGHINSTQLVTDRNGKRYILQRISDRAFKDVPALMENKTMAVYTAEPVADVLAVAFTAILFFFVFRKAMGKLEEKKEA